MITYFSIFHIKNLTAQDVVIVYMSEIGIQCTQAYIDGTVI